MSDQRTPETNTPERPEKENRPKYLLGLKNGKEWSEKKLRKLLERSEIGVWGDEPSDSEKGVKVLRAGNYKETGIDLEDLAYRSISKRKQGAKELKKGDIVVERSGGSKNQPVGRVLFFDLDKSNFYPGNFLQMLRPDSEKVNNRYLYDQLQYRYWRGDTIPIQSNTTNIRNLQTGSYLNWNIPLPEVSEQRRIASVLYNVDQAIQKTEEIIEQTRRVKKGLMQDLFAKGYYNHKEYQESRTGPLKISKPKDWSLETISDTFKIIDGDRGKAYPSADEIYKEGYCLFLNAGNVTSDGLKFDETEFVTRNKDEELRKGKLERGDLIVTTRGTVGNVGFYSSDIDYDHMRINSGMIILRPKVECNHKFFYYLFNSEIFQKQIENVSYGTAQPQISVSIAQNLAILVPSLEEQNKVTEILDSLEEQIQKNEEQLEHLHRIKIGLMQDLLTGKVRTRDKDIEVLDEVLEVEKS